MKDLFKSELAIDFSLGFFFLPFFPRKCRGFSSLLQGFSHYPDGEERKKEKMLKGL